MPNGLSSLGRLCATYALLAVQAVATGLGIILGWPSDLLLAVAEWAQDARHGLRRIGDDR